MNSMKDDIREYTEQLRKGQIQRAYKGIMCFMSELKAYLEGRHADYAVSVLYFGYMDMTYFAFTPPGLRAQKLKIAVVYLHGENRFELWLAAANRKLQAEFIEFLRHKDIGGYALMEPAPGVDAIISANILEQPGFDSPDELKERIEEKAMRFAGDMITIVA